MNITTANRLVQYRKARGMSQEELAATLGISRQAISKWERAEASPDTDNLIALARLYGVSLDHLLLEEGDPIQPPQAPPTAAAAIYAEPPAAPDQPQWESTPTAQSLYPETQSLYDERTQQDSDAPDGRKPLSREARKLLGFGGVLLGVVLFFAYGILSWIFPALSEAYPIVCTLVYLLLGILCNLWHPAWLIFLSIPLFYIFF